MLARARPEDHDLIDRLWRAPQNAQWIEAPDDDEISAAIAQDFAFLWQVSGKPVGFAVVMTWVPQVFGLSALCTTGPGQGKPLLAAVLETVFLSLGGHRIGLDVTTDNARAIRLYDGLGFQREGLIRECWKRPAGDWADCYLMGLLAREWRS